MKGFPALGVRGEIIKKFSDQRQKKYGNTCLSDYIWLYDILENIGNQPSFLGYKKILSYTKNWFYYIK